MVELYCLFILTITSCTKGMGVLFFVFFVFFFFGGGGGGKGGHNSTTHGNISGSDAAKVMPAIISIDRLR